MAVNTILCPIAFGSLDEAALTWALDEAQARGWTIVDMKKDWKVIYPFQQ